MISENEFKELQSGKPEAEIMEEKAISKKKDKVKNISTKEFLLGRKKESISVNIEGPGGSLGVEVKSYLTKSEKKQHKEFITLVGQLEKDANILDEKEDLISNFLASITLDEDLDYDFWMNPDLDTEIGQEILIAFFKNFAERMDRIQNFR